MHLRLICATLLALGSASTVAAAPLDEGNGLGGAFIRITPGRIGGAMTLEFGSGSSPLQYGVLVLSAGLGPSTLSGVGSVCLDLVSSSVTTCTFILDATGNATLVQSIPAMPSLVGSPHLYLMPVVADFTLPPPYISIAKTVRLTLENGDAYNPTIGAMASARSLHSATSLSRDPADDRTDVLVSGGGDGATILDPVATDTTELYHPLTRTFSPGPTMAVPRTLHRAGLLPDGRVLLAGGADDAGVVTTSCEIFDPATGQMTPTGSLSSPRVGHAMTVLLDGRVLVSGGLADFQNGATALGVALNTAQATYEVWDPATGLWTPAGTTSSPRTGHTQTLLPDGTVLIAGGVSGAVSFFGSDIPIYTATCDIFDPITSGVTQVSFLTVARGFHAASVLANGDVLVTGGIFAGGPLGALTTSTSCERFDGISWTTVGPLPQGVMVHSQVAGESGEAIIMGGQTGNFAALAPVAQAGHHDGMTFTPGSDVGVNAGLVGSMGTPRSNHTCTRLYDGSFLVLGGFVGPDSLADGLVFVD